MSKNTKIKDELSRKFGAKIITGNDFRELTTIFGVATESGLKYRLRTLEKQGFLQKISSSKNHTGWAIVALFEGGHERNVHPPLLEVFNGTEISLFKTPKGYAAPTAQIARATGTDPRAALQMLVRNAELFDDFVFDVYDANTKQVCKCLTRDGIIGYVIKISSGRLSGEVRQKVIAFQRWAIETLGALLEHGTVEVSPQEYEKNLMAITGLSKEGLQKVVVGLKKENLELQRQKHNLAKRNEALVGDVIYLKEKLLQRTAF